MANEIEIRVSKVKPGPVFDQIQKDAKAAGKDIETSMEKGFKGAEKASGDAKKQIGQDLDKTAAKAKEAGGEAGKGLAEGLHGGLKDTLASGDVEGAIGGLLDGLKGAGGAVAAAGAGIGAVLITGITQSFEEKKVGGLLAAQIGGSTSDIAKYGKLAGDVFAENYGESLDQVGEALHAVFATRLIDKSANVADIKAVTESVMTVATVTGESFTNVGRAAQQLVRTGLAGSVTEALDLITKAEQNGLNASEDLLDTVTEYSTKFRDLGLSGQEAFGLIQQAVAGGARDTDTAADALKEFAIRAQDGSASTVRGFTTVGLSAADMGNAIAQGGSSAHQALGLTLDALRNIHDPIVRDQAAVDLFGTKAEDLGDSLFSMDLDGAKSKFGAFADAAKKAGDRMTESTPIWTTAWKNLSDGVTDAFGAFEHSDSVDGALRTFQEAQAKLEDSRAAAKQRADEAANAWRTEGSAIHKVVETMDQYISKQKQMQSGVLDLTNAEMAYQQSLDDAEAALKANGKTLDIHTQAGRDNQQAIDGMAESAINQISVMQTQGASLDELTAFTQTARDEFIHLATGMGMSAGDAQNLADRLRLIPGNYEAHVYANTASATNSIQTIHGKLVDLTNRTWIASVAVTGKGMLGGGKMFVGMASGGAVGGGDEGYLSYAAEGGPRGRAVMTDEMGPEIKQYPDGTTVIPAGLSRSMAASMAGGRGGSSHVQVSFAGDLDSMMATAWMKAYNDGLIRIKGLPS